MELKRIKDFQDSINWSTRFYVLAVVTVFGLSFILDAWSTSWVPTIIGSIGIILFIEVLAIYFHQHPKIWRTVRFIILLLLTALLLIGSAKAYL